MREKLRLRRDDVEETLVAYEREDRFSRFRLIQWWDQQRLQRAKVVVVGAGALGNEIVKNLALLGVGQVLVCDMDTVEDSNLSRSVLFRAHDNGKPKALVAATAARDIYPQMRIESFCGNVIHDLGLGVFRWADIVLGGLDNREARLTINRNCWRLARPWIDGAIEQIRGWVRFFMPDGPCYECTLSEIDWKILQQRRSCNLLTREEMESGKTPTTPTISSIIAGVQCQEAVKYLHGLEVNHGRAWIFEGVSGDSYTVALQRKEDCLSHDILDSVVPLHASTAELTVGELLTAAKRELGPKASLEFAREMIESLVCPRCGKEEQLFQAVTRIKSSQAWCPHCDGVRREVRTFYRVTGEEPFLDTTCQDLGIPPFDIVFAVSDDAIVGLEFDKDASRVLGQLVASEEDIECH